MIIINPIIPIWFMTIICIILIMLVIYNKQIVNIILHKSNNDKNKKQKNTVKYYIINTVIKCSIIILLFIMNLRFMIPNGEAIATNSNVNVLFVIDTSVSMRALDYDGNKERMEGVINDCCYTIDKLSNCKFSIITFGDNARRLIPFTDDTDMVQAELKAIRVENDYYAKGSSLNIVKDVLEDTLKKEKQDNSKVVVFFITDGEITKQEETLESFSTMSKYIDDGAVMGYGTQSGGKMVNSIYADNPNDEFYYIYYYENYEKITALSKIDENNLKQIASDLNIDYIQMNKTNNIDYKINNIIKEINNSQTMDEKMSSYQDIYYYFAIPLVILLIIDYVLKKRSL